MQGTVGVRAASSRGFSRETRNRFKGTCPAAAGIGSRSISSARRAQSFLLPNGSFSVFSTCLRPCHLSRRLRI